MAKARLSLDAVSLKLKQLRQLKITNENNALRIILRPRSKGEQELSFVDSVQFLVGAAGLLAKKAHELEVTAELNPSYDPRNPPQDSLQTARLWIRMAGGRLEDWLAEVDRRNCRKP